MANNVTKDSNLLFMSEYIKNILYFAVIKNGKVVKSSMDIHFFTIDDKLIYENFYNDFGPLNLGCVYKYCNILNEKLKEYLKKQVIVHYTSSDPKKKANAAFLLGCYGVLYLKLTPSEALKPLYIQGQYYRPFQDAVPGDSCFTISLIDCLNAIKRASDLSLFKFNDFNCEEYDRWGKYQGGDLNWIIPGKFIAFIGPIDNRCSIHPPEKYISYFKENEVNVIIRLNERHYDAKTFTKYGIRHYDLIFPDGSCPPRYIVLKFLQISEESKGAIAVHCKAGLGRTGSLIGCYLIKHYRMSAREAIGWMRICRPGSVIGHQQGWLEKLEPWLLKQGNIYRKMMYQDVNKIFHHEYGIYSIEEKFYKSHSLANEQFLRCPLARTSRIERPRQISELSYGKNAPTGETCGSRNTSRIGSNEQSSYKIDLKNLKNKNINSSNYYLNKNRSSIQQNENSKNRIFCRGISPSPPKMPVLTAPKLNSSNKSIPNSIESKRSNSCNNRRDDSKKLCSTIVITSKLSQNSNTKTLTRTPSYCSTAVDSRCKITHPRRRLGRSPSPPPVRMESQHRATNTPTVTKKKVLKKDSSVLALKEALSKLRVSKPRDNSIGVSSLGAGVRGGQTGVHRRSTSARSDEQPLATQGDLLNSIKYQRRFRETVKGDLKNNTSIAGGIAPSSTSNVNQASASRRPLNKRLPH